jgi:hypothetical protein
MTKKTCLQCGEEFEANSNALYCSGKCRTAAHRNGNNKELTEFEDQETEKETVSSLPDSNEETSSPLIPVTVMLSPGVKKNLENKAKVCGVELSKYISVRSQMDETDIVGKDRIISKLQDQIEELKIKLSFFKDKDDDKPKQEKIGLFVEMNRRQMDFLVKEFIDSNDFDDNSGNNQKEYLEREKRRSPVIIERVMAHEIVPALCAAFEKRSIDECEIDEDYFEENPLYDTFLELGE